MSSSADQFEQLLQQELRNRDASHLLRFRRPVTPIDATHVLIDGRRCVNFCSNNYLGLTHHPRMIAAAEEALRSHGVGSGAAGLITGHTDLHAAAENEISQWKKMQSCVLLPSGYQANHAAIQTLAALTKGSGRFLIDKLVHASLIDAAGHSGLPMRVFPHNNLQKLHRLLARREAGAVDIVVTESIFSMDGDAADLRGLIELKRKLPFTLLLDEAHAGGVYGPDGSGLAAELGCAGDVDIAIVTLSKGLGLFGGAVCASESFCSALLNFGRAYIYSTSVPPLLAGAVIAALKILRDEPERQTRLRNIARQFRANLAADSVKIPPGDSPIVPLIVGDAERAIHISETLMKMGYLVMPVRPPTVPPGSSRLRVTLSCEHTDEEMSNLTKALQQTLAKM